MKIRVVNQGLSEFNRSYKVKNINYDMVIAVENDEFIPLFMEDIELIPENEYDEMIIEYRDILKIKLGKSISMKFYAALINCIEERIGKKLISLDVLRDEYSINKRGVWEKKLILVVNHAIPLDISVIGEKYAEQFSITFKDITLQSFIEGCGENIKHIRREIEEKENSIKVYKRAISEVLRGRLNSATKIEDRLPEAQ
ncbi:hypothetical protein NBE98_12545 [Clostridium swellfunianum]|uniref:hypothetical protein n=1 Tax=Clostridium swellfunianum TaxID=1367462 RepID=UPI0020300AE9|nr:hypothetical protein [Clostridium swellfunianum]MCM0649199.1 hypothetical protein [Clostridium swellfunianum]